MRNFCAFLQNMLQSHDRYKPVSLTVVNTGILTAHKTRRLSNRSQQNKKQQKHSVNNKLCT